MIRKELQTFEFDDLDSNKISQFWVIQGGWSFDFARAIQEQTDENIHE